MGILKYEELERLLISDKFVFLMRKENFRQKLINTIPELKACLDTTVERDGRTYNVFEHTLQVINHLPKDIEIRLAALFHDIGKPLAYRGDNMFRVHGSISSGIFDKYAEKFGIDPQRARTISLLVHYHDIPLMPGDFFDIVCEIFTKEQIDKLFILKSADRYGKALSDKEFIRRQSINEMQKDSIIYHRGIESEIREEESMKTKNVITFIDSLTGECIIGEAISDYVTREENKDKIGAAVSFCAPGSFKPVRDKDGKHYQFQFLPASVMNKDAQLFVLPRVLDVKELISDITANSDLIGDRKIYIPIETPTRKWDRGEPTLIPIVDDPQTQELIEKYPSIKLLSRRQWDVELRQYVGRKDKYLVLEAGDGARVDDDYFDRYEYYYSHEKNFSKDQMLKELGLYPYLLECVLCASLIKVMPAANLRTGEYTKTNMLGKKTNITWSEVNLSPIESKLPVPYYSDGGEEKFIRLNGLTVNLGTPIRNIMCTKYREFTDEQKKQVFGTNYKSEIKPEDMDLIQALEIERISKGFIAESTKGCNSYESLIISRKNQHGRIDDQSQYNFTNGINFDLFDTVVAINQPTSIVLVDGERSIKSLANLSGSMEDVEGDDKERLDLFVQMLEDRTHIPVTAIKTGANDGKAILSGRGLYKTFSGSQNSR